MNPSSLIPEASAKRMEEQLTAAFHQAEGAFRQRWQALEEAVRKSPTAAILIAVGVGHCLHRLPLRSILGTQFKLLWALAPPGLLAAAATKAYQMLEERRHDSNGNSLENHKNEAPQKRRTTPASTSHSG